MRCLILLTKTTTYMDFSTPEASFFDYISANLKGNPKDLRLRTHGKDLGFDTDFAITQIECRQRAAHKLSSFISNPLTLFPTTLAYEQASHEGVAKFHASLPPMGASVIDMTAGLGIDSMAFAKRGCKVVACDIDKLKSDVLKYNTSVLRLDNLSVINADSTQYMAALPGNVDVIFIDPARRSETDRRHYNMHDCTPDVLTLQEELLRKCHTLIIKASPLLDITQTLKDIPSAKKIRVVSVAGECKEVLVEASDGATLQSLEAIDLRQDGEVNYSFSYLPGENTDKIIFAAEEEIVTVAYLYEPGAALMKLMPWGELGHRFPSLRKFGASSHLFVSSQHIEDFPGRRLRIESIIDKKSRKTLKGSPANIVVRNYPLSADKLRKKLGMKEGKDEFIYASRLGDTPILLKCIRI